MTVHAPVRSVVDAGDCGRGRGASGESSTSSAGTRRPRTTASGPGLPAARPGTARLLRTARWFAGQGVRVEDHPLVWHTVTADRLRKPSTDQVEAAQRGRIATVRLAAEEARAADPTVTLLIDDVDLSTAYGCLLEGLLEAGVRIDAIGLQSRMHQGYRGEERTLAVLDRLARWWLPLHLTETTLRCDEHGRVRVAGFLGDHRVRGTGGSATSTLRVAGPVGPTVSLHR